MLLREAREQPLLVIFEDLHWIDGETQPLLDGLVESLGSARLLLLVNYRPEYQHAWGSKTYYSQVVATVSNWGAYGVEVALSAVLGARDALHDLTIEHRMLEACSRAGGVDGRYQTPD